MGTKLTEFIGVLLQIIGLGLFEYTSQFLLSVATFFVGTLVVLGVLLTKTKVNILESYVIIVTALTILVMAVEGIMRTSLIDYRVLTVLFILALVTIPFYSERKRRDETESFEDYSSFNTRDEGEDEKRSRELNLGDETEDSDTEEADDTETEEKDEKPFDKAPNSNNTKAEMKEYLDYYNIDYDDDMLKDEIYDLVKEQKKKE